MIKYVISGLLLTVALFGNGEKIYDRECLSCHQKFLPKSYVKKHLKELKAPPMIQVVKNLKKSIIVPENDEDIQIRVISAFMKDYIKYPDMMAGFCSPFVYDLFGEMPSLKDRLTQDEVDSVINWIVEEYYDKDF